MQNSLMPEQTGDDVGQYFDQIIELYRSSSKELTEIISEVRQGKTDRAKKLSPVISEIRKASLTMMEEARNVEDLRRKLIGDVHERTLDLGGARDEIGRRMARIRASISPEGVS